MRKSLLLSSILLTSAGCVANQGGLDLIQSEALGARAELVDHVFVSSETYSYTTYDWVTGEDGSHHSVDRVVQVKVRLKFIQAENYELDDQWGEGLDYEVVVEKFVEATGETFQDDNYTFFVRKNGSQHTFFNCGSTRRCWSEHDMSTMSVRPGTDGRQVLRIGNHHEALIDTTEKAIEFVELTK
jgi:hypothetical protein